ncbi:glutathione S-transferase-like [Diceros bicornis minor]|uniref:glutathione S-transferase-like n=1 Tax=Diceros bicornis minor TaxID=77932 RepID=UPI0026F30C02|nr:glutathione S-transferase-like [Diceros bicornis minor]
MVLEGFQSGRVLVNLSADFQEFLSTAGKPKLHYFNGRGRMETIWWLLAAAGVEFEEALFETREEFEKLIQGGNLMYERVPMVEMDGINLVETRAILRYIAAKYDLYGRNLKEQAWIDMYVEGLRDLSDMIIFFPLSLPEKKERNLEYILGRATTRSSPVYEKAQRDHGQDFLVGSRLSWADTQLLEVILMTEECMGRPKCKPSVLPGFPLLQEFKARISHIPTITKFLQPGSQRKPPLNEDSIETMKSIFRFERGMFLKNMGTIAAEY